MRRTLTLASLLLIFATAAEAAGASPNLAFVGRTQNTSDTPNTSITLSTPAGIQDSDVMLVFIAAYNSTPAAPSGWTPLGTVTNTISEVGAAFVKVWHAGDQTSYTFGNVNWPKAVMRVYRGVIGVDSSNFAASDGSVSSLTMPALAATTADNDIYVAFFINDTNTSIITGSSDLADAGADQTQWASLDGDKIIPNQGTAPLAEAAVLSPDTGNWVGFAATLGNLPSPQLLPYGNVPPPSGQAWYVTLDDEFDQDTAIDTSKWNGGPGGPPGRPFPMCQPAGAPSNPNNVLGWSSPTCSQFFGTYNPSNPVGPYLAISPGVGLLVQDLNDYTNLYDDLDPDQDWVGLQNYGRFSQVYGYFEVRAKMPTDNAGEGDGLHQDIWITINSRPTLGGSDEVDFGEQDLGTQTTNFVHCAVVDAGNVTDQTMPATNPGDLSAAFHTYGLYWHNTGSGFGSFQCYFDGVPQGSPVSVTDPGWGSGVYIFPGWQQQWDNQPPAGNGVWCADPFGQQVCGAAPTAGTSNNNPLIIQYVRVWQSH